MLECKICKTAITQKNSDKYGRMCQHCNRSKVAIHKTLKKLGYKDWSDLMAKVKAACLNRRNKLKCL